MAFEAPPETGEFQLMLMHAPKYAKRRWAVVFYSFTRGAWYRPVIKMADQIHSFKYHERPERQMIETLLIILSLLSISTAAYFFADSRAKRGIIKTQAETIEVERAEKKEWQTKALRERGQTPLNWQPPKPDPNKEPEITPRVVHRGQLVARRTSSKQQQNEDEFRARSEGFGVVPPEQVAKPNLKYQRVVEKVGEIVNATRD